MNRLAYLVLGAVALLIVGFGAGWHGKSVHDLAGRAKDADARVDQITRNVQAQASKLQQQLQLEQDRTLALHTQHDLTRASGTALRLEIDHVVFTAPADAAGCVDPLASDEFERLYNAAAANRRASPPGTATAR